MKKQTKSKSMKCKSKSPASKMSPNEGLGYPKGVAVPVETSTDMSKSGDTSTPTEDFEKNIIFITEYLEENGQFWKSNFIIQMKELIASKDKEIKSLGYENANRETECDTLRVQIAELKDEVQSYIRVGRISDREISRLQQQLSQAKQQTAREIMNLFNESEKDKYFDNIIYEKYLKGEKQ